MTLATVDLLATSFREDGMTEVLLREQDAADASTKKKNIESMRRWDQHGGSSDKEHYYYS